MIFEVKQPQNAAFLFAGWQETMIWSCLQGVQGKLYGDSAQNPVSAMVWLGDFCFLAGKPDRELVSFWPEKEQDFVIMVPQSAEWGKLVESRYTKNVKKVTRYATKKEPGVFDREKLQAIADALPDGYILREMDETLFGQCKESAWCRDWVSQYADYAFYQRHGLGAVLLKDGEPVSGASSYASYQGGIEIEIDTRRDCRRRGFAAICGAKLILDCLKRGWYPSWDAQNTWSLSLAQKLGYRFDHAYTAYEVERPQN